MLKERIKIVWDCYKTKKGAEIENLIEDYQYISFDLFDTLVKRHVCMPEDIFKIVEEMYNKVHRAEPISQFVNIRKQAEAYARKNCAREEVTLQQIYKNIECGQSDELMELELKIEYEMTDVNQVIKPIFDLCVEKKKPIFIISDIYLPKEHVLRLLDKCGLTPVYKVYVSSELGLIKQTGNLFKEVVKKEKIDTKLMLHIGDSYESDYVMPRSIGITACKIRRYDNINIKMFQHRKDNFQVITLECFFNHMKKENFYYDWGYRNLGVFLWQYTKWLADEFRKEGLDKIYFFSRDGYIMKQAFDYMEQSREFQTYYLEVSRRSLRVPILWMNSDLKTIIDMVSPSERIAMISLFEGTGLEIQEYLPILEKYGFQKNSSFYRASILMDEKLNALFEEIRPDLIYNSKREYEYLKQYLEERNLEGKIAIVDIGWSGGMQRYLQQTLRTLGVECEIFGYYTGIAKYVTRNTDVLSMNMKGYVFDFYHNPSTRDERAPFVGLFETLFLEQRGSVEKYIVKDGVSTARRYEYEYNETKDKVINESACIREVQRGALQFIKDIQQYSYYRELELSSQEAFGGIQKTGNSPSKEELKKFAEIRFFDEGECGYLAKSRSLFYYILHVRQFKEDFLKSRWKTAFLKQMLKLPLSYDKVYDFMYKLSGRGK